MSTLCPLDSYGTRITLDADPASWCHLTRFMAFRASYRYCSNFGPASIYKKWLFICSDLTILFLYNFHWGVPFCSAASCHGVSQCSTVNISAVTAFGCYRNRHETIAQYTTISSVSLEESVISMTCSQRRRAAQIPLFWTASVTIKPTQYCAQNRPFH